MGERPFEVAWREPDTPEALKGEYQREHDPDLAFRRDFGLFSLVPAHFSAIQVHRGNTSAVWRLDRLDRALPHLITTMTDLEERGIGFRSLRENIDTTTSGGKLIFHNEK
jgi:Resolvase, N terminal domain